MQNLFMPSILSADFADLGADIEKTKKGGAKYLHFDVMDGVFVPSISFGMPVLKCVRKVTDMFLDVHLMIIEPERYIDEFALLGADGITFHYETAKNPQALIEQIKSKGLKAGVAINPDTPVECIYNLLDAADMILIMTVQPGFGGQKYIEESTERIKKLRAKINECKVNCDIQVDGGINDITIKTVLDAGANAVVAGSAVFKGDITANTRKYMEMMESFSEGK